MIPACLEALVNDTDKRREMGGPCGGGNRLKLPYPSNVFSGILSIHFSILLAILLGKPQIRLQLCQ